MSEIEKLAEEIRDNNSLWIPGQSVLDVEGIVDLILTRESTLKQAHAELLKDSRDLVNHMEATCLSHKFPGCEEVAKFKAKYPEISKEGV